MGTFHGLNVLLLFYKLLESYQVKLNILFFIIIVRDFVLIINKAIEY